MGVFCLKHGTKVEKVHKCNVKSGGMHNFRKKIISWQQIKIRTWVRAFWKRIDEAHRLRIKF